jgi:hypothetical protein
MDVFVIYSESITNFGTDIEDEKKDEWIFKQ